MARPGGELVGRKDETAELAGLAVSAMAGEGQTAFVIGEAGLGKTALLEAAAVNAGLVGMEVLCGTAQEVTRQQPFALVAACLGVDAASADTFRARVARILRGDARYGVPGAMGGVREADFSSVRGNARPGRRVVCAGAVGPVPR